MLPFVLSDGLLHRPITLQLQWVWGRNIVDPEQFLVDMVSCIQLEQHYFKVAIMWLCIRLWWWTADSCNHVTLWDAVFQHTLFCFGSIREALRHGHEISKRWVLRLSIWQKLIWKARQWIYFKRSCTYFWGCWFWNMLPVQLVQQHCLLSNIWPHEKAAKTSPELYQYVSH